LIIIISRVAELITLKKKRRRRKRREHMAVEAVALARGEVGADALQLTSSKGSKHSHGRGSQQ
jgi:hypothetical protein